MRESANPFAKSEGLPENFAQKLISLEIQCDRPDATKAHLNSLMDLYTMAIEHYNLMGDDSNQEYFQGKLQRMLTESAAVQLINIEEGQRSD